MSPAREDVLVGALEAGGTKLVCAVGSGPGRDLRARIELPTGDDPARALSAVLDWLIEQEKQHGKLGAIGIASFGPVNLDPRSPTYGHITNTPKESYRNIDVVGPFRAAFPGLPIGFDTDVNGAALGEFTWGGAQGLLDFVYITIGTGIGAGAMARGRLLHGLVHPEMGHMLLPAIPGDTFEGICRFHGRCWEGLCSGPAIKERTGLPPEALPADHEAFRFVARYVAMAMTNIFCVLSPRKIILGGSVRKAGRLGEERFFKWIREDVQELVGGYIDSPALREGIEETIIPPLLGDDAGICGAIALGRGAAAAEEKR